MFADNAAEFGLPYDGPPIVRREFVAVDGGRRLERAGLGRRPAGAGAPPRRRPERPHVGHRRAGARPAAGGHRPARPRPLRRRHATGSSTSPSNAADVADGRSGRWRPTRTAVVGMSLGGMTTIALAQPRARAGARGGPRRHHARRRRPRRPRRSPPSSTGRRRSPASTTCWPARWSTTRPARRRRCAGASCTTPCSARTDRGCGATPAAASDGAEAEPAPSAGVTDRGDAVGRHRRAHRAAACSCAGMRPQSVVDDGDEAELLRR